MTDSDDDDYELPNLSERIQASFKSQGTLKSCNGSRSNEEESEISKFSERIHNTPCSQVKPNTSSCKLNSDISSDSENEESELLKFSKRIRNTPCTAVKSKGLHLSSASENEESEFLKFSERIRNTPQVKLRLEHPYDAEESSSDEVFPNLAEKVNRIQLSEDQKQKQHLEDSDSDSDERFSNFITEIRMTHTPMSQNNMQNLEDSDSDSDEKFSDFITKIRLIDTPKSQNKKQHLKDSDSESDEKFSDFATKIRNIYTPKSQNKHKKEVLDFTTSAKQKQPDSSDFPNKNLLSLEGSSCSGTVPQIEIEKEYASLFPSRSDDSLFNKRRDFYTRTLFEFFNKKVFDSKLPGDIPLIWDALLVKTAGLTVCRAQKGVYSCSIKLSAKLLTSFGRLQDTLLHEMCHAAVWVINKKNVGHGPLWQLWASRCQLILPFIECPERCHTYDVPYRFWYRCNNCNWKRGACRRIKRYHGALCKRCCGPITMTVNN